ncbi:putative bifunctional diguanylate cyclase/phosphodiesterase [Paenibacillus senegalensis]|uniref:putative bifunctional diguanylate cyclase/phosphodiesterase n=1 Tax=Paenibacillus senegalensis TaxID=1465766 RepID=UPI00028846C7|nr:EAL domain-containing protein [Paenibacillus senegalensis]
MFYKSGRIFSLGHTLIPVILFCLYGTHYRQPIILWLACLFLLWSFLLIYQAFFTSGLYSDKKKYWLPLVMDSILYAAIFTLPDWQGDYLVTWLVLFLVPIYAFELGIFSSLLLSLIHVIHLGLFHITQHTSFWSLNTLFTLCGVMMFMVLAGYSSEKLNKMANFDPLTMLPNRLLFRRYLNQALKEKSASRKLIAVLFLDLDRFKYINDTMGHLAGDELLMTVAQRIKEELPPQALLARLGGDEYTLLLPNIKHPDEAAAVSESIIRSLEQSIPIRHREVFITTSIGIALFPDDGKDTETLMKNADIAMYRAKEHGGSTYQFYAPPVNTSGIERIQMETMLRHALERDEFVVHYQPRIDADTGELVCVEALARWNHPELGMIPPKDFIPLAEDTGLVIPLGEQILYKACSQRKRWLDIGLPPFRVSVNLSPRQFRQKDLPQMIERVLKETRLSPEYLELELTESAAMQDVTYAEQMLNDLKRMLLTIAIDDFGTGYSSLSYLKKFPIDVIKIDQSFISGIHKNSDDAAIVKAIIALAHTLKLNVTAEGVETLEQLDYLKQLQCNEVQGYLIGKPMSTQTLNDWIEYEQYYKASK